VNAAPLGAGITPELVPRNGSGKEGLVMTEWGDGGSNFVARKSGAIGQVMEKPGVWGSGKKEAREQIKPSRRRERRRKIFGVKVRFYGLGRLGVVAAFG
jgi:hypothetical protein